MVELDPAVEDAEADARPGGVAPGPLAGHLVGQREGNGDPLDRLGRQAPGGKRLALGFVRDLGPHDHAAMIAQDGPAHAYSWSVRTSPSASSTDSRPGRAGRAQADLPLNKAAAADGRNQTLRKPDLLTAAPLAIG
jgi:hypothetical protein